ncbi:MAG: lipoyl synthase [Bacillota bacterium]
MAQPNTFPAWIKKRIPAAGSAADTRRLLDELGLNTVCQSAACPNLGECFALKTAAFLIMGRYCTRNCSFCAVEKGDPEPLDPEEPERVARAVERLGLRHAVVTSVTRDDLPDGGAGHFGSCISAIRKRVPGVVVEVLTPDFGGNFESVDWVTAQRPDIFNHNLETVPRLYPGVRPQANYSRSLEVLERVKAKDPSVYTKSGLMVGLGETFGEIKDVLYDLRSVGCDIVTIGQYLRPSPAHTEVVEFVEPALFQEYTALGEKMGFKYIAAAPFVRSSYNAREFSALHMKRGAGGA